jgi:hypothetical protein
VTASLPQGVEVTITSNTTPANEMRAFLAGSSA